MTVCYGTRKKNRDNYDGWMMCGSVHHLVLKRRLILKQDTEKMVTLICIQYSIYQTHKLNVCRRKSNVFLKLFCEIEFFTSVKTVLLLDY